MSKNIELEILKEVGKVGDCKVAICRWSDGADYKVQCLQEFESSKYGKYYKGKSSFSLAELNEFFKIASKLKPGDFEKGEKKSKGK